MSRNLRTFLFIFFAAIFAIGAPSLVLYAQGYRLNWPLESGKKLLVKTGGFYVKTTPKQASVYVEGKLADQTDFFFGAALVENLLPRQYEIEIKKTGYQAWGKKLEIREKEVAEARNVMLFPDRTGFSVIGENIDSILLSPDSQKIALREKSDTGWNLKLYDIQQNITSKLADQNNFSGKNTAFNNWTWSDAKTLAISVTAASATTSYAIAIDKNPARISKTASAFANSTSTKELAAQTIENTKYYLANDGYIYKKELQATPAKAAAAQIELLPGADYKIWSFGDYFFVKINSELFVLRPGAESFEKIFDKMTSDPKLSPDGQKIVYSSDSEIWLFFLKNKTGQPPALAGDKILIVRLSEKISSCEWFSPDYLIFTSGEAIKTAEIDNRDKVNIATLAKLSDLSSATQNSADAQIIWNNTQKSVYLFIGGTLYKSQPIQ